ncbi:MAG TPA: lysylphosphatidylglycerol synthase domain-containing protein [Mycobacteriales bacterium]|nr:lysylphosphatidylglycerol synthase domain-containing protein [Mycobacteriales bacterium]
MGFVEPPDGDADGGVTGPADGPVDEDAPPVLAARRRGPTTWLKFGFLALVLGFGGFYVASRWDELVVEFRQMSVLAVLAAAVLAAFAQVAAMRAYRTILADLGAPLPVPAVGRLYFVGQLGKYLPGTVWVFVSIMTLGRELKIMRKTSLATTMVAFVMSIATGLTTAALLLPWGAAASLRKLWFLGLLLPVLLVGLHPRVFGPGLDRLLRLARRQPMPARLTGTATLHAAGWQFVSWLLFGLHAWVLVLGVGGPANLSTLAVSIGGFALAYGIGPLAVIAPAGAGVREAGMVLTLGTVVSGTAALAIALVSRIVLVGVDFAQAASWTVRARRAGRIR